MIKKALQLVSLTFVSALLLTAPAFAGKPSASTEPIGNDVSYPQCGRSLPTSFAFGIVGVNGGKATTTNSCLAQQLAWANKAKGTTSQPKVQLYVNTANPGEVIDQVTTWPTSSTSNNPYGTCAGANDLACSWQYGYNRAVDDVALRFTPAAQTAGISTNPGNYTWWLDVETMNTWQASTTDGLARNAASLEGMTAYFTSFTGATVGLYSTSYQWGLIAGNNVGISGNLAGLKSWLAGASGLSGAKSFCTKPALTAGGTVVLTQYVSGRLDYDYSCVK